MQDEAVPLTCTARWEPFAQEDLRLEAQTGARMDARAPAQIVSLLCLPEIGYLGISDAARNLSDWAGGEHRFRQEEGRISRAEFKLLEALSVFRLALPAQGGALDMG